MGELMPQPRDAMRVLRGSDPLAPRLPARVQRAIDRESAWGLVATARAQAAAIVSSARIDAVGMVTETALLVLDRVQSVEATVARKDPLKADRASGLVDEFHLVARHEIRRTPEMF
jgi:hypothetical protein